MIIYEEAENWADEEPFFTFEIPLYHVIFFEGVNVANIIRGMLGDLILPYSNITDKNHPMFKEVQKQINEGPDGPREIKRIILPLRYTKVFEA